MKRKTINVLAALCAAALAGLLGLSGCTEVPSDETVDTGQNRIIQGVVRDIGNANLLQNARVYLTFDGETDSTVTGVDGLFRFEVNLAAAASHLADITVRKTGFQEKSILFTVVSDTSFTVAMSVDLSSSALMSGSIRDSATGYPLRNTIVLLTLPGVVDQFVTGTDGEFYMYADLVDLDSIPVNITAVKDGYRTQTITRMARRGVASGPDTIRLQVDVGSSVGQVAGHVIDNISRVPLNNAIVVLNSPLLQDSLTTAGDGSFSFSINLQGFTGVSGQVRVSKNGYDTETFDFFVGAGEVVNQDVFLDRDTTTGVPRDSSGTGLAHSIALIGLSPNEISVNGVGGTESSIITWEVRDSLGFPIDIDHSDTVTFTLVGGPVLGGAYVSPSWAKTNVAGRVATTINSGTISGVLQFIASLRRESDGVTVTTTPVVITVNAGLPDQTHYTIAPFQYNFAAYNWLGRENVVTVQVGDKYSNPVKTGTAVYFNTTGGVIAASGFTAPTSHASVVLYSGNPLPRDPTLSPPSLWGDGTGYAWVRAHSLGENNVEVLDSSLVLFSGISNITLSTSNVTIDSGGCVNVDVTISDQNGNPLAPGTVIRTEAVFSPPAGTNWSVLASGLPSDPFTDMLTRGPGHTDFTLRICDGTPGGTPATMPFYVKVSVVSPNGNTFAVVNGDVGP